MESCSIPADEALKIASLVTSDNDAELIQLVMQYQPHPPYRSGDPSVAHPGILKEAKDRLTGIVEKSMAAFKEYSSL